MGTLKINQHLRCNNRHVYLEFFSDYPRRDKFLYARSSYNNLPGTVLADSENKRELKDQEKSGADPDGKRNRGDQALCKINFDMKNVKMKIPKVPFTIHGRLMAKDDFFPTAVANFELAITKAHLQDRRDSNSPKNPEAVDLPLCLGAALRIQVLVSGGVLKGLFDVARLSWASRASIVHCTNSAARHTCVGLCTRLWLLFALNRCDSCLHTSFCGIKGFHSINPLPQLMNDPN